jgi:ferrochelatase
VNSKLPNQSNENHPKVKFGKTGVLIANLGTPDGTDYWSMRRYLGEFLSDRRVIDYSPWLWQPLLQLIILTKRPFSSGAAYKTIWNNEKNESPLLTITKEQSYKLNEVMKLEFGNSIEVEFCMRYGNPSTESKLNALLEKGCSRIIFLPLYPHYAGATSATANDSLFRSLMKITWQPSVRTIEPYFQNPGYIKILAESVSAGYESVESKPEVLVTSYHGVPKRYLTQGDPYHCQCQKTTRLLKEKLGWSDDKIITTFQSKFGPEEWLQPYTVRKVAELAQNGIKNIAVIAPAFASDCIETLEEIKEEIRESFENAGGEKFTYIPCLNASEPHIEFLKDLIIENGSGWL